MRQLYLFQFMPVVLAVIGLEGSLKLCDLRKESSSNRIGSLEAIISVLQNMVLPAAEAFVRACFDLN